MEYFGKVWHRRPKKSLVRSAVPWWGCTSTTSRDLVPVCTHDPWLHLLTDIPAHPHLAGLHRRLQHSVVAAFTRPPPSAPSWWVWDLTWEQVAGLRLRSKEPTMDR